MNEVLVYGRSDDLIEVDGDIGDEFGAYDGWHRVEFNDGTALRVGFGVEPEKAWSVAVLNVGDGAHVEPQEPEFEGNYHYTDRVKVSGSFTKVRVVPDGGFNRQSAIDELVDLDWRDLDDASLARVRDIATGWLEATD